MADTPAQVRALNHVAALSCGPPVDGDLRVTLNFHPDRTTSGRPILVAMREDGCYRSQFVTGTSNLWRRPGGAAPRFGSAHVRLTAQALARSTFCHPDSVFEPTHFGVAGRAGLLARARPGEPELLDDYVEAQVHGPVRLDRDVEALVLDPCYQGTTVEAQARALPCPVEWHPGWRLTVAELVRHPDYRGPEVVEAGVAIAVDGFLDGRVVGEAVSSGRHDPQTLKRVWHCVARFGSPAQGG